MVSTIRSFGSIAIRGFEATARAVTSLAGPQVNLRLLTAFRWSYAFFGVLFVWDTFRVAPFLWPYSVVSFAVVCVTWVSLLLAIACNFYGRVAAIAHYVFATAVFNVIGRAETVDNFLYCLMAFWLMWLPSLKWKWGQYGSAGNLRSSATAWPVYLLGINFGIDLFFAGLAKAFDPLWFHGQGLYYTVFQPWIKHPVFHELLGHSTVLTALNYVAIGTELGFLPLFLLRATRPVALVLLSAFFAQLTFPFQLGYIGPFGLVMCVALWSITPLPVGFVRTLRGVSITHDLAREETTTHHRLGLERLAIVALVGLMMFCTLVTLKWKVSNYEYPLIYPPLAIASTATIDGNTPQRLDEPQSISDHNGQHDRTAFWKRPIHHAIDLAMLVNRNTLKIKHMVLFNSHHSLGMYGFFVEVEFKSGKSIRPVAPFALDLTSGPDARGLEPRWILAEMYGISRLAHEMAQGATQRQVRQERFSGLMRLALGRVEREHDEEVPRWIRVKVRPIVPPTQFASTEKPWEAANWTTIYEFDCKNDVGVYCKTMPAFPLDLPLPGASHQRIVIASDSGAAR